MKLAWKIVTALVWIMTAFVMLAGVGMMLMFAFF